MKRTLAALNLSKSPLVFVLGQVRFETILALDSAIPKIQDALRLSGFIEFAQRSLEVTRQIAEKSVTETTPSWEFIHKNKRCSFLLERGALAFQTTAYTSYEELLQHFEVGLSILAEFAQPQEVRRIGLRYVDVILPQGGKEMSAYVHPGLLGVPLDRFGRRLGQATESVIETGPTRRFVARYTEAFKGMALPLDLLPVLLQFKSNPVKEGLFAILDTDHFDTSAFAFTTPAVLEAISSLHDTMDQVFRALVTEEALLEWK